MVKYNISAWSNSSWNIFMNGGTRESFKIIKIKVFNIEKVVLGSGQLFYLIKVTEPEISCIFPEYSCACSLYEYTSCFAGPPW